MKRILSLLLVGLIVAIAVPSAVMASQPDTATTVKKKRTYCQRTGASIKAKLKAKSKRFYVYLEKGGSIILICQDKPKFYGEFSIGTGDTVSTLRVSTKRCAVVKVTGKTHNPQLYLFSFADFLAKNGQASIYTSGFGQPSASIEQVALSRNCVAATAERVNGVPGIAVQGTSAFGYTGTLRPPISPNMTDNELAAVKIFGTGASATVSWTEAGVAKTYVYAEPAPAY
ncbi:MAG: hypothetical protein ACSLFF_03310 [Solirubrobacterales bacterium]